MALKYEVASLKDLDEIMRMAKDFDAEHFKTVTGNNPKAKPHLERRKDSFSIQRRYFARCLRSEKSRMHIARDGKKIVGYSLLHIKKNIPVYAIGKRGHFGDLYVKKEYRGRGVSSRFKELGLEWFRKKGLKAAVIGLHWGNTKAKKIYEGWRFVPQQLMLARLI